MFTEVLFLRHGDSRAIGWAIRWHDVFNNSRSDSLLRLRSFEIRVYWKESRQIPHDIDRGDWRLQVQYVRDASMKPGQCDDLRAKQLWERTDAVSSNLVEIKLHVTDWDAPSTRALSRRIAMADVLTMRVASAATLAGVFPQTKEALFWA